MAFSSHFNLRRPSGWKVCHLITQAVITLWVPTLDNAKGIFQYDPGCLKDSTLYQPSMGLSNYRPDINGHRGIIALLACCFSILHLCLVVESDVFHCCLSFVKSTVLVVSFELFFIYI